MIAFDKIVLGYFIVYPHIHLCTLIFEVSDNNNNHLNVHMILLHVHCTIWKIWAHIACAHVSNLIHPVTTCIYCKLP